ncbi:MAG: hypothetical protein Q8761_03150, partial [Sweet potato little leaf phytoplasma]|nr:hypothetical protein [Sweet potato little leaf phytoplasma]
MPNLDALFLNLFRIDVVLAKEQPKICDEAANVAIPVEVETVDPQAQLTKALAPVFDLRLRKLEIPVFSGANPYEWLHQVERYFVVNRLADSKKIEVVVLCLDAFALKWHYYEQKRRPIGCWEEFRRLLLKRFLPTKEGSLHERFFAFKQETTIAEYCEKFEDYSAPLDNLDNATLEGKFVDGLKDDIKIKLRVARPIGLDMIMETTQK